MQVRHEHLFLSTSGSTQLPFRLSLRPASSSMGLKMLNHKFLLSCAKNLPQFLLPGVPFSGNLFTLKYAEAHAE